MNGSSGKCFKALNKWKEIPERKNDEKIKKLNAFERTLFKFSSRRIKQSFRPLQQFYEEGNAIKMRWGKHLIDQTVGKSKF